MTIIEQLLKIERIREAIRQAVNYIGESNITEDEPFGVYPGHIYKLSGAIGGAVDILEAIRLETNRVFQWTKPGTTITADTDFEDYPDYLALLTAQTRQWVSLFEQIRRAINRQGVFVGANEPFDVFPERIMMISGGSEDEPDLNVRGVLEIQYSNDEPFVLSGDNTGVVLGLVAMENVDISHIYMVEKQGFSELLSFDGLGHLTGADSADIAFFDIFVIEALDTIAIPKSGLNATDTVAIE